MDGPIVAFLRFPPMSFESLVNPTWRVYSTLDVPCQRSDWWIDELRHQQGTLLASLPLELKDMIFHALLAYAERDHHQCGE